MRGHTKYSLLEGAYTAPYMRKYTAPYMRGIHSSLHEGAYTAPYIGGIHSSLH